MFYLILDIHNHVEFIFFIESSVQGKERLGLIGPFVIVLPPCFSEEFGLRYPFSMDVSPTYI